MAQEWSSVCIGCGSKFQYSHSTFRRLELLGEPLPLACPTCEREFLRERRAIGRPLGRLETEVTEEAISSWTVGHFGKDTQPWAEGLSTDPIYLQERHKFGVSDERLIEFYGKLDDPMTQVILVEAPTGAGKSTFFPFRLLSPPPDIPDPEVFTRNGQIVVTQPRIQATIGIPNYVRKLHGCSLGAGFDVGRRCSKEQAADWNCRLVYLTDGTLINWIAGGMMANISLIMLDEAHERSMNIDLIIGLLTKMLPCYPWLKLVIASATIDHKKFMNFFDRHLRGGTRCDRIVFEGKPGMPVRKHFQCGHVQWEDKDGNVQLEEPDAPREPLPYDPGELKPLLNGIAKEVADRCVEILERMHPSDASRERGIPDDLVDRRGDVLGFLLGETTINDAVAEVKRRVSENPVLKECVQVLPFYSGLPLEEQQKVIAVGKEPPEGITTVIISTNAAETSLTLTGVKHVVETGLINRSYWDTRFETSSVRQVIHSQAGCRQRWGRAGRVSDGDAWPLYTKKQFDTFPRDTDPAILCTRLEQAVLTAKYAGVDRLDGENFPWLDPPPPEELDRALHRLRQHGAIDEDGDITAHGIEIQKMGGDPKWASLLILADRFSLAVEMATILPLMEAGGRRKLLVTNNDWDQTTNRQVQRLHAALASGCHDDLELVLKIFAAWREARAGGETITGNWAWDEIWKKRREAVTIPAEVRETHSENITALAAKIAEVRELHEFDAIEADVRDNLGPLFDWVRQQRAAFQNAASETWAKLWFVNHTLLQEVEIGRDDRIDRLAVRKREKERRNINFEALDRLRALLAWASPDSCFLAMEEEDRGLYERLSDYLELKSQASTNGADSVVESDDADEDQLLAAPIRLEVDAQSVCHHTNPDALIALSLRQRKLQSHPNAEAKEIVSITFTVLIDCQVAEAVAELDATGLAHYFARHLPPSPVSDDAERYAGPVRERMFMDQRFPVFSQFRYTMLEKIEADRWLVELNASLGYWPASRAVQPVLKSGAKETDGSDEEEDSSRGALTEEEMLRLFGDGDPAEPDPESKFDPEPLDESDPEHEDDDLEQEKQEEGKQQNGELEQGKPEQEERDQEGPEHDTTKTETDTSEEEPPKDPQMDERLRERELPELFVPQWRPLRVELQLTRPTVPREPIAEVVAYDSSPGKPTTLILETPTPELSYELFTRSHDVGEVVRFEVVGKRAAGFKRPSVLLVREPESGLELEVGGRDLAFAPVPQFTEDLEEGDPIDLQVVGRDDRQFSLQVTQLPLVENWQTALFDAQGRKFQAFGSIAAMSRDFVRFVFDAGHLLPSSPDGVLMAAEYRSYRHKIPLRCEIGRECNFTVQFNQRTGTGMNAVIENEDHVFEQLGDLWGESFQWNAERRRLTYSNNYRDENRRWHWEFLTDERRRQALDICGDSQFQAAIGRLYRQANKLEVEIPNADFAKRYPVGMRVRGCLIEAGEAAVAGQGGSRGRFLLDCGLTAAVPPEEFREDHSHQPGEMMAATVLSTRSELQRIDVTLMPPALAAAHLRTQLVKQIAHQCGVYDVNRDSIKLKYLSDVERDQLAGQLDAAQQDQPWFAWARMRFDANLTGWLLGQRHTKRMEIEQRFDVLVCADRGDLFLLATRDEGLEDAMRSIEHHLDDAYFADKENQEPTERLVVRSARGSEHNEDMYAGLRTAPVGHVARIPAWRPPRGPAKDHVRTRLSGFRGLLVKLGLCRSD